MTLALSRFQGGFRVQMNDSESGGAAPPQLPWEALGVACFWVAMKADGDRSCLPSRTLLEKVCGIAAASFTDLETVTARDDPLERSCFTRHKWSVHILSMIQ